jgi:hypothetical protein
MGNLIFDSTQFRRDLSEVRDFEKEVCQRFDVKEAGEIAGAAQLDVGRFNPNWPPTTYWAEVFERAAKTGSLEQLVKSIEQALEQEPKDRTLRNAIKRVREVDKIGGSLFPMRMLLAGERPFLGRTKLRGMLPELQNWDSAASILVVRGEPDSGRTETQFLISDNNADVIAYVPEDLPLASALRHIWKVAGASGEAPKPGSEPLTTESAMFIDFWTDVKVALDTNGKRLWMLFDDLDKGAGRVDVRALAEVLAIRLKDVTFQRRIRLVLLGYPAPQLPAKVTGAFVRNDTTETLDETHVRAFLDFCMKAAGKNFDEAWLSSKATDICTVAQANTSNETPYLEALHAQLKQWYKSL